MEEKIFQKPCAVQKIETSQGFSVSYKEHFLYSKYNPKKNIITAVENLQLLPGTIILCCSPLLGYGLSELLAKLPENCLIVLCEAERELFDFTVAENTLDFSDTRVLKCKPEELNNLPLKLYDLATTGAYKRVTRLDMSAGTTFYKEFYDRLYSACSDSVMTFWKNRITLTKFGRRYSKNLFENLKYLSYSRPVTDFFGTVNKPIIVFGAGESTQKLISSLRTQSSSQSIFSDYFILCADTALQPLLKNGIHPDGVFIEEAQTVITKAFIGVPEDIHIFAGLSSIPTLAHKTGSKNISYFFTEYTKASFLDNLKTKSFMPPSNMPYGSVGLTAVHYALKFRKDDSVPVYVTGLDFSYSTGVTHTKNALAHILRLITGNRLNSIANYNTAYGTGAEKFIDKGGKVFITTPSLKNYAMMFNNFFGGVKNLFDAGECGIPLAIARAVPEPSDKNEINIKTTEFSQEQKKDIQDYLKAEKEALEYLRDLLTGKTEFTGDELSKEIRRIVEPREYLYLHFPDGHKFELNQSFLNRIRTEIENFIKYLCNYDV